MVGGLDAVVIATPAHSHAVISAGAIRAGKYVFNDGHEESRAMRVLAQTTDYCKLPILVLAAVAWGVLFDIPAPAADAAAAAPRQEP